MLNVVSIGGRATSEPNVHATKGGKPYVTIRLANPRGSGMSANFVTIEIWGRLIPTTLQRVKRGSIVLVSGKLVHREWHDDDGRRHEQYTIKAYALYVFEQSQDVPSEIAEVLESDTPDDLAA